MISAAPARPESGAAPDAWFTRSKLLLLLAIFVIMAFPTIVIGTSSFFYRDMGQFGYPLAQFHREAFWRGEFPLWNPLNNCGLPFLAQWNTLVLYPGSLLYLLLPLPWSLNLFMLAHLFLAAAGMYALAFRWTDHRFAASVAGLAFAWNGLTLHALMWPNNIAALAWMPWVVLALERAWREGGRRIAAGALVGAVQMLTGAPEIILLTWIVVGLLWFRDWLGSEQPRGRLLLRILVCGTLSAAVCAAQLLPFIDLLRHSNRDTSFAGDAWSMPLWGWANFLVPMFGCTPALIGVYSQDSQQWTSSYYVGASVILLALLAFRGGDRRAKWLGGITLAGLVLALGQDAYVYAALKKVLPLIGFIRFPIKYVVLVTFTLPLLAALGLAGLQRRTSQAEAVRSPLTTSAAVVFGSTILIIALAWLAPPTGTSPATTTWNGVMRLILLMLIAGTLLWLARQTDPRRQRFAMSLVLTLLGLDVLTHMPRQNPVVPNAAYGSLPLDMTQVPKLGESRAMISPPMDQLLHGLAHPDPFTLFTGHRRMLLSDCNLIDHVPKVNGFYSLYLREADEVNRRLYRTTNYHLPLLDFLGVTQLSAASELFSWLPRTNALLLVTGGQRPVFATPAETSELIFAPSFKPDEVVYLPPEAKVIASRGQLGSIRLLTSSMAREKISASVESKAPSLVVIAQAWSPAWKAYVDMQAVPLWKANHAYQALLVPAGAHRVELRYEDNLFRLGVVISVAALLACLVPLARRAQRPDSRPPQAGRG